MSLVVVRRPVKHRTRPVVPEQSSTMRRARVPIASIALHLRRMGLVQSRAQTRGGDSGGSGNASSDNS